MIIHSFKICFFLVILSLCASQNAFAVGTSNLLSPRSNGAVDPRVCFDWTIVPDASYYTIQVSNDTNFNQYSKRWIKRDLTATNACWSSSFLANATAGSSPSKLLPGTYYWRIKSMTDTTFKRHDASFTGHKSFTVVADVASPSLISPSNNKSIDKGLCFDWSSSAGASYYTVQVSSDTNFDQNSKRWVLRDLDSTQACWSTDFIANPTAGSTPSELPASKYYWRVKAMSSTTYQPHRHSFSSHQSFSMVDELTGAKLILPQDDSDISSDLCFDWEAVVGAAYYTVQVSSDTNFDQNSKRWVLRDLDSTQACWNTDFIANPTAGSTPSALPASKYYWRVKAMSSTTYQPHIRSFSSHQSFSMVDELTDAKLILPQNDSDISSDLCFDWEAVVGAAYYTVQVSSDTNFDQNSKRWVLRDVTDTQACWGPDFIANPTAGSTPPQLSNGRYFWRIKSLTGKTFEPHTASFTEPRAFTMLANLGRTTSINFNEYALTSYGHEQDNEGFEVISNDGLSLTLQGNRWKAIKYDYELTPRTVLEFDFRSTEEGEIHGIGMDDNSSYSAKQVYQLYGSQKWGIAAFQYVNENEFQHFVLPIGKKLTGPKTYLFFIMDQDDEFITTSMSQFKNVKIYEMPIGVMNYNGGAATHISANEALVVNLEPTILEEVNSVSFSIDGLTWHAAQQINSVYTHNFGMLGENNYTVRVRVNGELYSDLDQIISVSSKSTRKIIYIHTDILGSPVAESQ